MRTHWRSSWRTLWWWWSSSWWSWSTTSRGQHLVNRFECLNTDLGVWSSSDPKADVIKHDLHILVIQLLPVFNSSRGQPYSHVSKQQQQLPGGLVLTQYEGQLAPQHLVPAHEALPGEQQISVPQLQVNASVKEWIQYNPALPHHQVDHQHAGNDELHDQEV